MRFGMMGSDVIKRVMTLLLCVPFVSGQAAGPAAQDQIGYKSAADAEQKKTLLLQDFQPVHATRSGAPRGTAKFYVIDVHNHVNDAARIDDHMAPAARDRGHGQHQRENGRDPHRHVGRQSCST